MSKIDIFLLDILNNSREEINLIKPNSYQELLKQIEQKFMNLPQNYEVFILDTNNIEIKIKQRG